MGKGDLIKVPGYTQKITYNGNIEYRPWSEDLVGNQQTTRVNGDIQKSSSFTISNFQTQTSPADRTVINNYNKLFGQFFTLKTLNIDEGSVTNISKLLKDSTKIRLNVDYRDISKIAYFGSATEYIRVTLENIIMNWPASIYVSIYNSTGSTYTMDNYVYDEISNTTTFNINNKTLENRFDIVTTTNGDTLNTFNEENTLRNLTTNYKSYVIFYEDKEYPILGFVGTTPDVNDTLYFKVSGSPFGLSASTLPSYKFHIKPNKIKCEQFFNGLNHFERNLLNRQITPKYTATFKYRVKTKDNVILNGTRNLTWPTSDGYNLDFNNDSYISYATSLLKISSDSDDITTDLITRFLVSESISSFDTLPQINGSFLETEAQKMRKLLRIYGREYDEIKLWIDGIKKSNTITYDKYDNAPDQIVKELAYTMGWDITNSFSNNDFLKHFLIPQESTYSGLSIGYTPQEAETEMWRRLILNSAFLFKSKGSRKAIEFFMRFIGAPKGLIDLNEYLIKAKNKIDIDILKAVIDRFGLNDDLTNYSVDSEGYPKLVNRNDEYFQSKGGWYRQTYGVESNDHYLKGNNPHIGPYDGGQNYFQQLNDVLGIGEDNFNAFTITNTTYITGTTNLFYNYNKGKIDKYNGNLYVNVLNKDDGKLNKCIQPSVYISPDPYPTQEETSYGCSYGDLNDDDMLSVCLKKVKIKTDCNFELVSKRYNTTVDMFSKPYIFVYEKEKKNINGSTIGTYETIYREQECCKLDGGTPFMYDTYNTTYSNGDDIYKSILLTSGYACLKSSRTFKDDKLNGGGSFLSCNWRLPYTNSNGSGFQLLNDKVLTIEDITWKSGDKMYLKFVSPKNTWGMVNDDGSDYVVGEPDFKYTNPADSGFCPLNISVGELVTDPITNEVGYGCKLIDGNKTLNRTNQSLFIDTLKLLYNKSVGKIGCLTKETQFYTKSLYE